MVLDSLGKLHFGSGDGNQGERSFGPSIPKVSSGTRRPFRPQSHYRGIATVSGGSEATPPSSTRPAYARDFESRGLCVDIHDPNGLSLNVQRFCKKGNSSEVLRPQASPTPRCK